MANPYFTPSGVPATNAAATSSTMRAEFNLIEDAFDLLPTLSGNGSKIIAVNSGASALEAITTTGTGNGVRATAPTLTTPVLGVATATSINKVAITAPATSATLTIADGKTLTASNTLTFTGTDASSVAFGTGGTVLYSGGALGTPSSGTLTNCTGLPMTTGVTGTLAVANGGTGRATSTTAYGLLAAGTTATGAHQTLAAGATTEILVGGGASALPVWTTATGSGAPVRATSPTLVTPALGVATATSVNKVAITAPATSATLTIADGKTLTCNNTLTLTGTDATSLNINAVTNLNAGVYTPTGGTGTNVSAVTPHSCKWVRTANVIKVSGSAAITTTSGSQASLFTLTLPVASNFSSVYDANGVFTFAPGSTSPGAGGVTADTINDIVQINFYATAAFGGVDCPFEFSYEVL